MHVRALPTIMVALRMPKAAMGITLDMAVARNAHIVVNDVTKIAVVQGRSSLQSLKPVHDM